ncbi:hypothetical protein SNEBB_006827 [Seison nebaliae]|nr:hypothetical protein SNEBB_006827 [Seison nebaliae]
MTIWIFGYGSLIWKVDFPVARQQIGYVEGYCRRFWQKSEDHRGFPGKPGRVLTLSERNNHPLVGIAYEVREADEEKVLSHLDVREKGGYTKKIVKFYSLDNSLGKKYVILFHGTTENEFYKETENLKDLAKIIGSSEGPSGKNDEYLIKLCDKLKHIYAELTNNHNLSEEERTAWNLSLSDDNGHIFKLYNLIKTFN